MKKSILLLLIALIITPCYGQMVMRKVTVRGLNTGPVVSVLAGSTTFDMTDANNYYDLLYSTARSGYLETNAFARGVFTTTATSMTVTGYTNIHSLFSNFDDLGVRVNGADYQPLNFTANGSKVFTVNFSAGTKTVEVITSLQTSNGFGTGNIYGSWPTQIVFNNDSSATVLAPPTQSKRIIVYGDSISVGTISSSVSTSTDDPSLDAWPVTVRNAGVGTWSVIEYGWGYASLHDDCSTDVACQSLADRLTGKFSGITNKYIYLQRSTNDYGNSAWAASAYGTKYAKLLDDIHANDAAVIVYAQTGTLRESPAVPNGTTANSSGSTLQDYRDQITTVCNARSSYCTVVDGLAILHHADIPGGLHFSQAGQIVYSNYIKTLFGIP